MEYYSATKKKEILSFETTWMGSKGIVLSQTEKYKYCMISLICEIKTHTHTHTHTQTSSQI